MYTKILKSAFLMPWNADTRPDLQAPAGLGCQKAILYEAAGDHFYNFSVRAFTLNILKNRDHSGAMRWATGNLPIEEPLKCFQKNVLKVRKNIRNLWKDIREGGENFMKAHSRLGRLKLPVPANYSVK